MTYNITRTYRGRLGRAAQTMEIARGILLSEALSFVLYHVKEAERNHQPVVLANPTYHQLSIDIDQHDCRITVIPNA